MKINEDTAVQFIKRNLSTENFPSESLQGFRKLVEDGNEIAAAKEYCHVTGASIEEAHLATAILKNG